MRMFPLIQLSTVVVAAIAVSGVFTAFYGATCAMAERDLKRILAYSTISQIGYMMLAVGSGAITAATFHLIIHAFFKALLFLGAGCIINAMHHEQDIFRMGGLRHRLPGVFWPFLAGALCLAGVPLTGGFFSKDSILIATWAQGGMLFSMLYVVALFTVFLTAVYTFRMLFLVFGERETAMQQPRQQRPHVQAELLPRIMEIILIPLAVLSLAGGLFNLPANLGSGLLDSFLAPLSEEGEHLSHAVEFILQGVASLVALAGIGVAWFYYGKKRREQRIARAKSQPDNLPGVITFLQAGWYFDKLYHFLFIRPFKWLSAFLWEHVDEGTIDDSLDRMALTFGRTGKFIGRWGSGRISVYMLSLVCGATLMIFWFVWEVL
jgi:NADH-quinone oxidoreductase subunit L